MISYEKMTGYNNKKEDVKCMIGNHYFKDKFNYQPYVCKKYHDFSMTVMNLSDFFLNIKNNNYRHILETLIKKKL